MGGGGAHTPARKLVSPPPPAAAAFGSDRSEAASLSAVLADVRIRGTAEALLLDSRTLSPLQAWGLPEAGRGTGGAGGTFQGARLCPPALCLDGGHVWGQMHLLSRVSVRFCGARFSEVCADQGCPPPGASPLLVPHTALPPLAPSPALPGLALGGARGGFSAAACGGEDGVRAGRAGLGLGRGAEVVPPQACPQERVWAAGGPRCGC